MVTSVPSDPGQEIGKDGLGNPAAERLRKEHRPDKKRRPTKKKERNEKIKVILVQVEKIFKFIAGVWLSFVR